MVDLLEPNPLTLKTLSGDERTYIISKFPAVAGREIVASYPLTAVPQLSDYKNNEAVMIKLMGYVAVEIKGNLIRLSTLDLINNHVPDWETLAKIEIGMMQYNTSFFRNGEISTFLSGIARKLIASISPTLTHSLGLFLERIKQHLKN